MFTYFTPARRAASTSASLKRHQAVILGRKFSPTMAAMPSTSSSPMAGVPASISSTPAAASSRAMAHFSASVNTTPGACSPSRKVVSLMSILWESDRGHDGLTRFFLQEFPPRAAIFSRTEATIAGRCCKNGVDLGVRCLARQRKAQRALQVERGHAHGAQHMARLHRPRRTGRARGGGDADACRACAAGPRCRRRRRRFERVGQALAAAAIDRPRREWLGRAPAPTGRATPRPARDLRDIQRPAWRRRPARRCRARFPSRRAGRAPACRPAAAAENFAPFFT